MTSKQLILLLVVLIGLGIVFTAGQMLMNKSGSSVFVPTPSSTSEPSICTMDAKMCPDGSYVGRQGPNCEFAQCPAVTATSTGVLKGTMGSKLSFNGVTITPIEVLEDSRCPVNVQCIQAGTVRVQAEVAGTTTSKPVFTLNQPLSVGLRTITLTAVTPAPFSGVKIQPADYTFTFEIK